MKKVTKPIPDGYHTVTATMTCDGAVKAIDFYKKAFGAEERIRVPGPDGRIMHAEIQIGDSIVMLNDPMPGCKTPLELGESPVRFYLYVKDCDAAVARATAAGATVEHPVSDMFWGDRVGSVRDPFGYAWSFATHVADPTPEEIAEGQQAFLAQMQGQGSADGKACGSI